MSQYRRRSLLYAPCTDRAQVELASQSDADGVFLDLESTVPAEKKETARQNLRTFVEEFDFSDHETVVRINSLRTEHWHADVQAAIEAGVDAIRLPKVEEPWEVKTAVETTKQIADYEPDYLLQLENPTGFNNGHEIARVCKEYPEVNGIGVGIGDYTKAIGVDDHTAELRAYLLNQIAVFATAGEMDALGYVHKEFDTLRDVVSQARSLGHVGQPVSSKVDAEKYIQVLNEMYPGRES